MKPILFAMILALMTSATRASECALPNIGERLGTISGRIVSNSDSTINKSTLDYHFSRLSKSQSEQSFSQFFGPGGSCAGSSTESTFNVARYRNPESDFRYEIHLRGISCNALKTFVSCLRTAGWPLATDAASSTAAAASAEKPTSPRPVAPSAQPSSKTSALQKTFRDAKQRWDSFDCDAVPYLSTCREYKTQMVLASEKLNGRLPQDLDVKTREGIVKTLADKEKDILNKWLITGCHPIENVKNADERQECVKSARKFQDQREEYLSSSLMPEVKAYRPPLPPQGKIQSPPAPPTVTLPPGMTAQDFETKPKTPPPSQARQTRSWEWEEEIMSKDGPACISLEAVHVPQQTQVMFEHKARGHNVCSIPIDVKVSIYSDMSHASSTTVPAGGKSHWLTVAIDRNPSSNFYKQVRAKP